jgi:hypothetical protein
VAVEENAAAVADGEASRALNRIPPARCRWLASTVEAGLARVPVCETVVLDPPREGCSPAVRHQLFAGRRPGLIVYVSCNPETLARDLGDAAAHGYAVESLQPVDMFPHHPARRNGGRSAPARPAFLTRTSGNSSRAGARIFVGSGHEIPAQVADLSHRYLGIGLCLLLVMWFGSGIVMIYAGGMPSLTPEARRAHMPPLDFTRVALSAAQAAERQASTRRDAPALVSVLERPAYRFTDARPSPFRRHRRTACAGARRGVAGRRQSLPRHAGQPDPRRGAAHRARSMDAHAGPARRPAEVRRGRRCRHRGVRLAAHLPKWCWPPRVATARSRGSA